jgi:la-related protein 1
MSVSAAAPAPATAKGNWAAVARSAPAATPQTPASPATPASPTAPDSQAKEKESSSGSFVQTAVPMAASTVASTAASKTAIGDASVDAKADTNTVQRENGKAPTAPSIAGSSSTHNEAQTSTTDSRKDDETGSEISVRPSDKGAGRQPQSPQARRGESASDSRRNRRTQHTKDSSSNGGDKSVEQESPPPAPKATLFEAPIPAVNPWNRHATSHLFRGNGSPPALPTTATPVTTASETTEPATSETTSQPAPAPQKSNGDTHAAIPNTRPLTGSGGPSKSAAVDGNKGRRNGMPFEKSTPRPEMTAPLSLQPTDDGAWPTPETANNTKDKEERHKAVKGSFEMPAADGGEDTAAAKGRAGPKKQLWSKLDVQPSFKYNTPLPGHLNPGTRSRTGGRGGREGGTGRTGTNGRKSTEKGSGTSPSASKAVNGENREGGRDAPRDSPRDGATNRGNGGPSTSRRGVVEGANGREQRRAHASGSSKPRDVSTLVRSGTASAPPNHRRHQNRANLGQENNQSTNQGQTQGQTHGHGAGHGHQQPSHGRERTEGRDRNRGANRNNGRNGFNNSAPQMASQPASPFGAGPSSGPAFNAQTPGTTRGQPGPFPSSTARGGPYPAFPQPRGGSATRSQRGQGRLHYAPHTSPNGRPMQGNMAFNVTHNTHPMHPVGGVAATNFPNSQPPYTPSATVVEQQLLRSNTLKVQINYYFTGDNLTKDYWLRKQMDSQGFVPVTVIASFKRVQTILQDIPEAQHLDYVLDASMRLENVEVFQCDDGVYRLRSRQSPTQWVLKMDERDELGQSDGPGTATPLHPMPEPFQQQYAGPAGPYPAAPTMGYGGMSGFPQDYYLNNSVANMGYGSGYGAITATAIQGYPNGHSLGDGGVNGFDRMGPTNGSMAFNADVPEFNPGAASSFQLNGHNSFHSYQVHGQSMTAFGGFPTHANRGSHDGTLGDAPSSLRNGPASPRADQHQLGKVSEPHAQTGQSIAALDISGTAATESSQANDIVPS